MSSPTEIELPFEDKIPEISDLETFLIKRTSDIIHLVLAKRQEYGTENIRLTGINGVGMRLQDKVSRLRNLASQPGTEIKYESLNDTLVDIVGYGLMGLSLMERGEW